MATTIISQGAVTAIPGVYTTIDDSALSVPSPQATGIIGLIGPATGGRPYTAIAQRSDMRNYTSTAQLQRDYPAGPLLEAANIAFAPSTDPAIPGGAQSIVALKANPATQARIHLNNADGQSLTLTAQAWGLGGNTIQVAVAPGTDSGIKLTISQGAITEVGDDLGNDPVGQLTYDTSAGYSTLKATKDATALTLTGAAQFPGKASTLTQSQTTGVGKLTITAAQADAGKTLTLYGVQADGTSLVEQVTLTPGAQQSAGTYAQLLGLSLSDAALDVAIADVKGQALAELKNNAEQAGLADMAALAVAGVPVSLTGQDAGATVIVVGTTATGAPQSEAVTLQAGQPASTVAAFGRVTALALGGAADSVGISAVAGRVATTGGATILMAQGALAAIDGLAFTVTPGDETTPVSALDPLPATELGSAPVTLVSDLEAIVDWVGQNSQLVTAQAAPGATGVPTATQSPVALTGGTESPAGAADYQACLDLLKQVRVNTVVCLSADPAVSKAVDAHCVVMNGKGQSDRDAVVGVMDAALVDVPTYAQLLTAVGNLNSRNIRAVGQAIQRYNTLSKFVDLPPPYLAVAVAGMQAGASVGTPLTHKTVDVQGIRQHLSWNPIDDGDALVQAGACIFVARDNLGVQMVRNVTTYTTDPGNLRCTEASVNQICNYVLYDLRTNLNAYVGQLNFSGSLNSIYARCLTLMGTYLNDLNIITAYQDPVVTGVNDTAQVTVSIAPTLPLNFIQLVVNVQLAAAQTAQSAAA